VAVASVALDRRRLPVTRLRGHVKLFPWPLTRASALCLLVQDAYGARPPYAVVVFADGTQARVAFSKGKRQD
jgi:hypothetical protein